MELRISKDKYSVHEILNQYERKDILNYLLHQQEEC